MAPRVSNYIGWIENRVDRLTAVTSSADRGGGTRDDLHYVTCLCGNAHAVQWRIL
jgi:hypothetical protein